jgi:glycosyltransferase involved in cell wall biosynthesis
MIRAPAPPYVVAERRPVTFSVVVPVFNAARLVGDALSSILAQTRPADEIIVSDDGSTDALETALAPFRDSIRLVHGPNAGPSAARNRAIAAATGDFVVSLDADDAFLPTRLERLAELAETRPDLDILATDALLDAGNPEPRRFNAVTPFAVDDQRIAIMQRCFVVCPAVRRSRLTALGGFDESLRVGEDWELMIRLILAGATAGLVDEPLYRYRLRPDSLSASRVESLRSRVSLLESFRSRPGLTPSERSTLSTEIAARRHAVLRAEAEIALREGGDARRAALRLATGPAASPRERLRALVWAVTPGAAGATVRATRRGLASSSPWEREQR